MANTGIKTVLTLRKYIDGVATSETKANSPSDPDYIAPYEDLTDCPISNNYLAGVVTNSANPTTTTTLTLNGNITNEGNPAYTSKGFYWKLGTSTPTASDNVITLGNTGTGLYNSQITGLTPGTQYTHVAWATNAVGTAVGSPSTSITNIIAYYSLRRCSDLVSGFRTEQTTEGITLGTNDRVEVGGVFYTVLGSTNSGTSVGIVTDTGFQGCPTTERFYNMELCDDPGVTFVGRNDSSENLAVGSSLKNNNTCYRVGTETTTSGLDTNITSWERFNTCTDCANSIIVTTTTTSTTSTTTTTTEYVPPANNAFSVETASGNLGHYVMLVQGYATNDYVTTNEYPGECFIILGEAYHTPVTDYITGSCSPVTTTTTQYVPPTTQAPCTQFFSSASGASTSSASCSGADTSVRRNHSGSGTYPAIGDLVYFGAGGCIPSNLFNGGNQWYFVGTDTSSIRINSSGQVIDKAFC